MSLQAIHRSPGGAAPSRWRAAALALFLATLQLPTPPAAAQQFGFVFEARQAVAGDDIQSLVFAPDGTWLAIVTKSQVQLFALGAGGHLVPRGEVPGLRQKPRAAAISPDGTSLAVADRGGALYFYHCDPPDRRPAPVAAIPRAHKGAATALAFTGDGSYLVSGGEDGAVRAWTPAGERFAELGAGGRRKNGTILVLSALGGDRRVLSVAAGHQVDLWQVDTQQALRSTLVDKDVKSGATGDGGKVLALGLQELSGNISRLGGGGRFGTRQPSFGSQTGSSQADAHEIQSDDRVRLVDVQSGTELRDLEGEHQDLDAVAVSPDGRFVAAAGDGASATIWAVATGKRISSIPCDKAVTALAFSPDGKWLLVGGGGGVVATFRLQGVSPGAAPEPSQEILLALLEPSGVTMDDAPGAGSRQRTLPRIKSQTLRVRGRIRSASPLKSLLVDGQDITSLAPDGSGGYIFNAFVPLPTAGPHRVEIVAENEKGVRSHRAFDVEREMETLPVLVGEGRRLALIVGVSHYADRSIDLAYAADDARALYKAITNPALGPAAFRPEDVRLLVDDQATVSAINSGLREFLRRARENDFALFFFAGHGAPDPNRLSDLYLIAHDTNAKNIAGTGLLMRHVREAIDELTARDVLILTDACHSAGMAAPDGRRGIKENDINNAFLEKMRHVSAGLAIFTASEAAQLSQEDARWGHHGVFTYYLLQGLAGAADRNGDHIVTLGELIEYVRENVRRATRDEQIPAIGSNSYDRGLPLTIVAPAGRKTDPTPHGPP